jgi:RimJ/RimL family protein N-acetyltransferase
MEVGWGLARQYWGQGYATEAAKASLDYGFRNYPVDRLISLIRPENHPSQKVAERLGQKKAGPFTLVMLGHSYPVDIWEITRDQWTLRSDCSVVS